MEAVHGPVVQKSVSELGRYLKDLVPKAIETTYPIKPELLELASETQIQKAITDYKALLEAICDTLTAEGAQFFKLSPKPKHDNDYPFVYLMTDLIWDIGYFGVFESDTQHLKIKDLPSFISTDNMGKVKHSVPKLMTTLRFLEAVGFSFSGVDLHTKKFEPSNDVIVSYPAFPDALLGLKVLAIADVTWREKRYKNDLNHDNLLRCDYRLIKVSPSDIDGLLEDFLAPLPEPIKSKALTLHKSWMAKGMTCVPLLSPFENHFAYARVSENAKSMSSRDLYQKRSWAFSLSPRHGYRLSVRPKKNASLEALPTFLKEKIALGYGCDRKLRNEACQGGCEGIRFPLDMTLEPHWEGVRQWLDQMI